MNKYQKSVDTTYLSCDHLVASRGFIHRDYLAHCLRYSHTAKFLHAGNAYKTSHLLDVGCGREVPLAKLLFSMRMTHTKGSYTGVDYGPVPWPETISKTSGKFKMTLHEKADFLEWEAPRKNYDVITSFEMLEHVEAVHAYHMLRKMRGLTHKGTTLLVSTPCYDPKMGAANNHVNEMSHLGFKALLEAAGLIVNHVWGTFASQKDYKKLLSQAQAEVFEQLSEYYDSNVVSCLMAPMFPAQARNCLWQLSPGEAQVPDAATQKKLVGSEHGSSDLWPKQFKQIMKEAV